MNLKDSDNVQFCTNFLTVALLSILKHGCFKNSERFDCSNVYISNTNRNLKSSAGYELDWSCDQYI